MGFAYKIGDQQDIYFVTFTVHQWVDVFTRNEYAEIALNSLRFCQLNKGLKIYAWVIMPNHLHLILSCKEGFNLSDCIRDFKKFTASKIVEAIQCNPKESKKEWLLWLLTNKSDSDKKEIRFWRPDNHPEEIETEAFFFQKLEYIHSNPSRAGYVDIPEAWILSSAKDFCGKKGLLELAYWND